jgi:hypothetical protein
MGSNVLRPSEHDLQSCSHGRVVNIMIPAIDTSHADSRIMDVCIAYSFSPARMRLFMSRSTALLVSNRNEILWQQ